MKKKAAIAALSIIIFCLTGYLLSFPAIAIDRNNANQTSGFYLKENSEKASYVTFCDSLEDLMVYVEADKDAFPEGTTMQLKEVQNEEKIITSINNELDNKEVKSIKAVDISFLYNDEEIEPRSQIRVSLTSSFIDANNNADNNKEDQLLVHIDDNNNTGFVDTIELKEEELEVLSDTADVKDQLGSNNQINEMTSDNTLTFEVDSFSVYAIVYTVDFGYENYTYSIEGGTSISLSDLLAVLGIENSIKDVESVSFSDNSLISVTKTENDDYVLKSLEPFETEETLIINLKNRETITVEVTDAQIHTTYITAEGAAFRVAASYKDDALIPAGSELEVSEISQGADYDKLFQEAGSLLKSSFSFIRVFDISIVYNDEKIRPATGVDVTIEYIDGDQPEESDSISVVHFSDDGPVVLSADTITNDEGVMEVSFSTESFSPFATISERLNDSTIDESVIAFFNFDEIDERGGFTSNINGNTVYATPIVTGKTPVLNPAYDGNVLKLSDSNENALSVRRADGSSLLTDVNEMTISFWEYSTGDKTSWAYYAAPNGNNQPIGGAGREQYIGVLHNGSNLTEERYYEGRGDGNYSITAENINKKAWHYVTVVYKNNETTLYVDGVSKGTKNNQPSLPNILGSSSIFQIGKANWGNGEYFTGYLDEMMIMDRALTEDEAKSLYNAGYAQDVEPAKQNKLSITQLINYALSNGIDTVTDEQKPVPAGSYRTAYPGKVLNNVIFFATEYDNSEHNYDYYAVTRDGGLAKVTDLGSEIAWKDPRNINWDLIVYTDTVVSENNVNQVVPSGYYELAYTDSDGTTHFLAPKLNMSSVVQNTPMGLQFAGPADKTYGTTIEAWDASALEQVGLKIQHETLVGAIGRDSEEFFFARNTETIDYTQPVPVKTIDSTAKGIQIKLFDYDQAGANGVRPGWMTTLIGDGPFRSGHQVTLDLVKNNLNNGIPVASLTNNTLSGLFGDTGTHKVNANHLFLQGTYDETGYFSYNSAQNYAYYNGGDFIVYDRAAAPYGDGSANYHGNFFPYNTFGQASTSQYMWYDVNDTLLTPDDPEYGTSLLSLDNINYSFGMELETDFYITKTGKDERGRDILYEFNGDDDLWVFVDDKLALDIGGVHGAIHGTINFTTGEIVVASENKYSVTGKTSTINTTVAGDVKTTLAQQFRLAYQEQGKTETEITALLDATFNKEGGQYTSLKPYTTHNMKMFYMESGAGASNLNIRFNLPVIPPSSFVIEKELPENVQADYTDDRFAFKVYVQKEHNSSEYVQITQDEVGNGKLITSAVYEDSSAAAKFENGILYLRPQEAIRLTISDESLKYYVEEVEIGSEWNNVIINNVPATIVDGVVGIDPQLANERARVVFNNVPKNIQNLLITKIVESSDPGQGKDLGYEFYVYLEAHSGDLEPYRVGPYYLTKTVDGVKHYYNNSYNDLGTDATICTYSGQNGTIGNVRDGYTIEIPGLLPGTDFYVVERMDNIPDGYIFDRKVLENGSYDPKDNDIVLVRNGETISPDGKIKTGKDAHVTVYNKDMIINLIKVDATNMSSPLQGAKFTLNKLDPEGNGAYASDNVPKETGPTGSDGKAKLSVVKNGYYELSETAIPAGYLLTDEGKIYIRVENGTVTLLNKEADKKVKEWSKRTLGPEEEIQFNSETNTFTVGNTPGSPLPNTGGTGTQTFYLAGSILILISSQLLLKKGSRIRKE